MGNSLRTRGARIVYNSFLGTRVESLIPYHSLPNL